MEEGDGVSSTQRTAGSDTTEVTEERTIRALSIVTTLSFVRTPFVLTLFTSILTYSSNIFIRLLSITIDKLRVFINGLRNIFVDQLEVIKFGGFLTTVGVRLRTLPVIFRLSVG